MKGNKTINWKKKKELGGGCRRIKVWGLLLNLGIIAEFLTNIKLDKVNLPSFI